MTVYETADLINSRSSNGRLANYVEGRGRGVIATLEHTKYLISLGVYILGIEYPKIRPSPIIFLGDRAYVSSFYGNKSYYSKQSGLVC